MKLKATLILLGILGGSCAIVFLLLFGVGRSDEHLQTIVPLPSNQAATNYVIENKLLSEVDEIKQILPGGPSFLMLTGTDENGQKRHVWVNGKDDAIQDYGSVAIDEGQSEEQIRRQLEEQGIGEDDIAEIFVTPYDYTSGKYTWFVRETGVKRHMLWYDYYDGSLFWEAFGDFTAWDKEKAYNR
ncbi:hypothetical protein [Paenibacillus senegalensis]|uniref:hypothetical protein n=1 Tax=Paenibacillus senegalensis TaxID=1465766 RepID=UPI000289BCEA|nr:hypothetical protein [Paenibacillus senegalensis]